MRGTRSDRRSSFSHRLPWSSDRGFGLVDVMITVGIFGILALASLEGVSMALKSIRSQRLSQTLHTVLMEVETHLSKRHICTANNFGGLHFDPMAGSVSLTEVRDGQNNPILKSGEEIEPGLETESLILTNFKDMSPGQVATEWAADLVVTVKRGEVFGPTTVTRKAIVSFETTPNSATDVAIDECVAGANPDQVDIAALMQTVCSSMGGSFNGTTNQCDGITAAASTAKSGSKCGLCDKGSSGSKKSVPCMGIDLCPNDAVCPVDYGMVVDEGSSGSKKKWCIKN